MKDTRIVVAVLTGLLVGGVAFIYYHGAIFLPLFIALILAYLLEPLILPLERRGISRSLAIFLVFFCFIALLAGMTDFLVAALRSEFGSVEVNLPEYALRLYGVIPAKIKLYLGIETQDKAYQQLNHILEALRGVSFDIYRETLALVTKAFSSTLSFLLAVIGYLITPVYLYYFLKDMPKLKQTLLDMVPVRLRSGLLARVGEIDELLSAFIRGQLSVCVILAVLYSIGLYFIGIDLAILIGTLAGITFIIPYFGTILGIVLSVIMALLKFHDFLHPLLCLGWFGIVQALEGGVITPMIVGDKVGLHPIITILALFLGGQLFGILGMLLAVPVAAVLKVLVRSLLNVYRSTAYYTGE
ncbi:MAG TPA: AI-2E family transporter [Geobacteraceae bacterium]